MFKRNDKSVFDKINEYLIKRSHELLMSIYLGEYNGHNIYIRFDYVARISAYKIVWFDLKYFDEKHIGDYISEQLVTSFVGTKVASIMNSLKLESNYVLNDDIIGDRVEILSYFGGINKEFVFDRFLPIEWESLIEPIALIFSYMPRSMEVIFNEMLALFDGKEEMYNSLKPTKFDLLNDKVEKIFRDEVIQGGLKYYNDDRVSFLEKIDDHYLAIVDGSVPYLVNIKDHGNGYVSLWCNCKNRCYCKHIYAVVEAIRNKKFNNFYKVKYVGKNETLLEKVTRGLFFYCFGIDGDSLLLVTSDPVIFKAEIMQNGSCVFEVIEDDDDLNLSKALKEYQNK